MTDSREMTMVKEDTSLCPYCGEPMKKWHNPPQNTWGGEYQFVCFNDECSYFVKGWDWMMTKFNVTASYRHRYDPFSGQKGPLPVYSYDALKSSIVEKE